MLAPVLKSTFGVHFHQRQDAQAYRQNVASPQLAAHAAREPANPSCMSNLLTENPKLKLRPATWEQE